jgi:hypothetical protein
MIQNYFFLYKYTYFQKSCTKIRENANVKDIAVFALIASSRNIYVIMVKMKIPAVNDMNLPGQNKFSKPETENLVASINNHVIGIPNTINKYRYSFAHGQINGPLT